MERMEQRSIGARGAYEEEQRSTPACSFAPLAPLLHFRGTDSRLMTVPPTPYKFTLQIGVSCFHNNTNNTTRHLTRPPASSSFFSSHTTTSIDWMSLQWQTLHCSKQRTYWIRKQQRLLWTCPHCSLKCWFCVQIFSVQGTDTLRAYWLLSSI
jgi:hypothetical protein